MCITELRHILHSIAERSGHEEKTAAVLREYISGRSPHARFIGMGGHSFLVFGGKGLPDRPVILRCDMDAVAGKESVAKPYSPKHSKYAHLCGHDGHAAAGARMAIDIVNGKLKDKAAVLFQGAEENGRGASAACARAADLAITPKAVIGFHNVPGYALGRVLIRKGVFAMSSMGVSALFEGRESHASEPVSSGDPLGRIMDAVIRLRDLSSQNDSRKVFLTITHVSAGTAGAFGVTPGRGLLQLTLRGTDQARLTSFSESIYSILETGPAESGVRVKVRKTDIFPLTVNDDDLFESIHAVLKAGGMDYHILEEPFRWSEDFGCYSAVAPSFMAGIGAGEYAPPLHDPAYDFPDALQEFICRPLTAMLENIAAN